MNFILDFYIKKEYGDFMLKIKKIACSLMTIIIFISTIHVNANALVYSKSKSGSDFDKEWQIQVEYTDEYGVVIGVLLYGFDKTFINEDYAHTRGYNHYSSQASLKRGTKSIKYGNVAISGYLSTVNVRHTDDSVIYYITLS